MENWLFHENYLNGNIERRLISHLNFLQSSFCQLSNEIRIIFSSVALFEFEIRLGA